MTKAPTPVHQAPRLRWLCAVAVFSDSLFVSARRFTSVFERIKTLDFDSEHAL